MVVLVAGGNGQLGQALQLVSKNYNLIQFVFRSAAALDISDIESCRSNFEQFKPDFCINAAAYTAVDKAESEVEKATLINEVGAKNLAEICKEFDVKLIHISTDFIFDGEKQTAYTEEDTTNPKGIYGLTKLNGEKAIQDVWEKHFIIRTSWVYSQFANNFMKTMLRLGSERTTLSVVDDQIGTPTNAVDLADAIVKIIEFTENKESKFGIYNYSNEGECSWFDFAKKIFEVNTISIDLQPIPTSSYPTPAERPKFSVLDKSKIKDTFGIEIKSWEKSLTDLKLAQ